MRPKYIWQLAAVLFIAPLGASQLEYVEAVRGLSEPQMDGGSTELEFGDIDGDGFLDLLTVGDHGSPFFNTDMHGITLWRGDGRGGFELIQTGRFGYGGLALGDVDNDGKLDVGYGLHHNYSSDDFGDQLLEVALGDGTGMSWQPWDDGLATNGESWGMFGTDFADVDGDGDLDLASISFGCCAGVRVYLNQGDGSWQQSFAIDGGNADDIITFGDVNGDGYPDLAAAHDAGTIYLGDGDGGFAVADTNLPPGRFGSRGGLDLGDVDGDGKDELAWIGPDGRLEIWSRAATGQWTALRTGLPDTGPGQLIQLADLDSDGFLDLAVFGDGEFRAWRGDGGSTWTPFAQYSTPSPGDAAAFRAGGDIDHNGRPDLAWVAEESGGFTNRNQLHLIREKSLPLELEVRWVAPGPLRTLRAGSIQFLDWIAAVPTGSATVSIAYSKDGSNGPWKVIAQSIPNSSRFQWQVPMLETDDLRLRIQVASEMQSTTAVSGPIRVVP